MELQSVETKSAATLFTGMERFSVIKGNRGSARGEMLDKFLARLNPGRVAGGYKPLTHARIGKMLAHIPTDDLYAFYQLCERSDLPFGAFFHWSLKPKKQ